MMPRVVTRVLRVAPPGWAVAVFVVSYLLCEGPVWYIQWKFGASTCPIELAQGFSGPVV